jgi:MOB kinase activator 1
MGACCSSSQSSSQSSSSGSGSGSGGYQPLASEPRRQDDSQRHGSGSAQQWHTRPATSAAPISAATASTSVLTTSPQSAAAVSAPLAAAAAAARSNATPQRALDDTKSLRAQKKHKGGSKRHSLHEKITRSLGVGGGNLRQIVKLPPSEDLNEWLAVHTIDFFNEICLLYGTINDLCSDRACPVMSAGPKFTYLWADGTTIKQPVRVPANEYVRLLMDWVDEKISDERVFPYEEGALYPADFASTVRTIFKRLFRVYAHMYHSHFRQFVELGAEAHLNTCFKRFIYFVTEFSLIDGKELEPLQQLIDDLLSAAAR